MPPKPSDARIRREVELERVRKRVLELHNEGLLSIAAIGKHPDVLRSKSTVQSIITRFKHRETLESRHRRGRPSKIPKRCVFVLILVDFVIMWVF